MRRICRSHGARSAAPPLQLCPPADTASASFAISSRKSSAVRSTLHSHLAGFAAKSRFPSRPGDPKKPGRVVKIEMFEGSGKVDYEPARIEVRRGEQIRFVLQNDGEEDHEYILATARENRKHAEIMKKNPEMEHDDPNGKRVLPHPNGEIVWKFTKRGTFEFACLIPGHYEKHIGPAQV